MKILMYSDPHIYNWPDFSVPTGKGYPTRMLEILETADWLCDVIKMVRPHLLVCLGDVFHTDHVVDHLSLGLAGEFFGRLEDAVKKWVDSKYHFVLTGNHDTYDRQVNSLGVLGGYARVIHNTVTMSMYERPLGFIPFIRDDKVLYQEMRAVLNKGYDLLFIHQDIKGAYVSPDLKLNSGVDPFAWDAYNPNIFTGHMHRPQKVGAVTVVGSCMSHTFKDQLEFSRGCLVLDTDTGRTFRECNPRSPLFYTYKPLEFEALNYPGRALGRLVEGKFAGNNWESIEGRLYLHVVLPEDVVKTTREGFEEFGRKCRGYKLSFTKSRKEVRRKDITEGNSPYQNVSRYVETKPLQGVDNLTMTEFMMGYVKHANK